jgi:hypothetical protein
MIDGKDNYQLDGDVVGESTTLLAEIQPGALAICVFQPKTASVAAPMTRPTRRRQVVPVNLERCASNAAGRRYIENELGALAVRVGSRALS